jgi:uncharacterized YccA/Bax inhibitor family protein
MSKYAKAIASALGGAVATGLGIWLGWDVEQINAQSATIVGAFGTLIPMLFTLFGPKNAD